MAVKSFILQAPGLGQEEIMSKTLIFGQGAKY
jgi:hypothetical protein